MKAWKKGAIIGLIWSILFFFIEDLGIIPPWLGRILFFYVYIARFLGFYYESIFIGMPLIGIIIGAFIGFLYDLRKEKQRTGKIALKLSYWQKGAILGVMWSLIGFGLNFIIQRVPANIPYIIAIPIVILFYLFYIPNILGEAIQFPIFGPLVGFLLGALIGYIYGKRRRVK